jgi:hypothetical protein
MARIVTGLVAAASACLVAAVRGHRSVRGATGVLCMLACAVAAAALLQGCEPSAWLFEQSDSAHLFDFGVW